MIANCIEGGHITTLFIMSYRYKLHGHYTVVPSYAKKRYNNSNGDRIRGLMQMPTPVST